MRADDAALSDGGRGRADEAGAAEAVASSSVSGRENTTAAPGGTPSIRRGSGLPNGGASTDGPSADGPARVLSDDGRIDGLTDNLPAGGPTSGLPNGGPVDGPVGDQSADGPASGLPDGGPVDDLPDDGGGGMSPVVREYVEGLRREALARDAQLRAQGIDPYTGVAEVKGPRRRLGARALVVLVVLVAAVSVGAYVVFFRGEPDYGMSHGYQVQSDGSLKRPPVTDKAPAQPAQMSKGDEAGAKAAARYYLKARAYAWNTGDTGPLKSISEESCMYCQNAITHVEEFYAHGYWGTGGYNDVTETQIVRSLDENEFGPGAYAIQLRFDEHMPKGYTSNGYVDATVRDIIIKLHVHWDGSAWRVMEGTAENAEDVK
ncbi:DUF6318 family protein [Schaalia georgiae]|uniref:DUF6318 family protein n=1 Tax=Schaalia georgiae TaxID=52768 RepID=UPI0009DB7835|nr:DUF6318 family protein [Schaalia georgiae]